MPPINKTMFLGLIFGPYALSWILSLVSLLLNLFGNDSLAVAAAGLSCFGLLFMVLMIVMFAILIYKLWETIQDGDARTTPGKACGFLFIPFFNFYWIFVALWGWSKDFNAYIKEKNVSTPLVSEGFTLTLCIVWVASILPSLIPFVGSLLGLVVASLLFVFFLRAIDGANAARAAKSPAPEPAA